MAFKIYPGHPDYPGHPVIYFRAVLCLSLNVQISLFIDVSWISPSREILSNKC